MNKMKKLLSVILAVVIALSCMSVMASAAKTAYKTVDELTALDAYSPYGQVTRLSSEERASMLQDFLDNVLPGLGINMGEVFNVLGLSVTLDLSSVDRLCYSLDTVADTFSNFLFTIAKGIVDLGILEELSMSTWQTGITRDGSSQLLLLSELLELLSNNTGLVETVFTDGLNLGLIGGMIGDLDLTSINSMVTNLPSLVKGLIFPMLERWDDTLTEVKNLDTEAKAAGVETFLNNYVKNLFTQDMSITTVKYDVNGTMTSEHTRLVSTALKTAAPATGVITDGNAPRLYYHVTGTTPGSVMTVYHLVDEKEAETLAKTPDEVNGSPAAYSYFKEAQTYVMAEEVEGNGVYVWKAYQLNKDGGFELDEKGNKIVVGTLKWYNDNSPFLPGFDGEDFDLVNMSFGTLLYTFIPVVFKNMAPVVLNGSLKKILAEFFGAKFTYVGDVGSDEVNALADSSNAFFTQEQGEYLWEWSDYAIINGNHYWRYQDEIWAGDISKKNNYFDIINWEYKITDDFMNEFIPSDDTSVNDRLLLNFNDFLVKVATTVTKASANTVDSISGFEATWTRPTFAEGNANLVANLKAAAQAVISLAPQHIFGSDYATNERCYYDLLMSADNDTVLTGIAAMIVDLVMPSMTLPGKSDIIASGAKVGAILAAVIREFAAYLTPEYNYDALIYTDFGATDGKKDFLTGKDSEYWFDVILTMGINVGFEYIRAFADMGEDSAEWAAFVTASGYKVDGGTYTEADLKLTDAVKHWEAMLDYVIDWALEKDYEWTWKMENFVDVSTFTVDLSTVQDPFAKLEKILFDLLPLDEVLTITTNADYPTKVEKFLRYDLILGLVDLRWDALINTIQLNGTNKYFRTDNVLDQLAKIVKGLVNYLFKKVGGGSYEFIPAAITDFDTLANHANIRTLAVNLVGKLKTAYDNGLLDTAFPILGFFLGWQTNPQKIADPQVWTTFKDGKDYALQSGTTIDASTTKINFLNNSAGMLETHRNSSVTDHAYEIQIRSVTSDATTNTLTFNYGDGVCSPWETLEIGIGGTYVGEEATTVTIAYDYVGKGGEAIGGTQYTSVTFLVSNQAEDADIEGRKDGDDSDGNYGIDPFKRYQFTEDIYTTVTTFQPSVWGDNGTFSGTSNFKKLNAPEGTEYDCDENVVAGTEIDMNELASTYFAYYQNQDGGWADSFPKDGSTSGKLYYAKDGVTAETEFPYGTYDMGAVAIKYSDAYKCWEIDYIYYNDYDIYDIYTANMNNGYNANQGVSAEIYKAYNDAWKLIVYGATYPMMTEANGHASTDYVKTIQPYIPQAIENFEAAKEAYEEALAKAQASGAAAGTLPNYVATLRDEIDNDFMNGKEINFQDYEFYEYFNYNDVKVASENLYRTYLQPEVMDTYYIKGSGIREAELDLVIAGEANSIIKAGITASRLENDPEAISTSKVAHDEWTQPINTRLYVEDFTSRLAFYKQFLNSANREDADHMYFLNKEIAFVEAQNLVADDYESVTWGRYADALAEAKAVAAGTDEYSSFNSRIYDVKYNLMVAYKQLLAKDNSLIEAGGTADLLASIATANEIIASLAAADGAWVLKEGVDADKAYAELISTLGYYYQARYSEHDVEVQDGEKAVGDLKYNDDGTAMMFNLYADSALEYADNDRPNKQGNQAKVDAANAALVAAMANFEKAAVEAPELGAVDGTTGAFSETTEVEGVVTGYIYGVVAGDNAEDYFTLVDDTAGYTKSVASTLSGGAENGTGAKVQVYNNSDVLVAEYTLIVFGDVNGDSSITAADYSAVKGYTMGVALEADVALIAADCVDATSVESSEVTASDYSAVKSSTMGVDLTVNPYIVG